MKKYEQLTINVHPGFTKKIDKMAERLNVSRSTLARNLIESAYEDAMILEETRLLAAFKFGQDVIRKIKEGIGNGKITLSEKGDLIVRK